MSLQSTVARVTLLASLANASAEGEAQQSDSANLVRGTTIGVSLDRFLVEAGEGPTAVSLRVTRLNPGGVGIDFAAGTYLPALAEGVPLLGIDLGPAYNLSAANGTGLLRFGVSTIVAANGDGGSGAVFGCYVGAGLVARAGPQLGIRADIAKRFYVAPGLGSATVWTMSFGLTSLTRGS